MAAVNVNVDGSVPIAEGCLYLLEERLDTFKKLNCSWPYDSGPCTALKMAEAGFYYCGTPKAPDWVRCVVCHQNIDGWDETDVPLQEHKNLSPKCAFLKIKDPRSISVGDVFNLEKTAMDTMVKMESKKLESDSMGEVESARETFLNQLTKMHDEETAMGQA